MDSLVRRRGMQEQKTEGTVYEWNYTMGLPEDIGWTRHTEGTADDTITFDSDGMLVTMSSGGVFWSPPTEIITSGVAEFVVIPVVMGYGSWNNMNGIALQISSGTDVGQKISFRRPNTSAQYIQHRYKNSASSYGSSYVYDNKTFGYDVPCFCKIENNPTAGKITVPKRSQTDYMNALESKDVAGNFGQGAYNASYRNRYSAFGLYTDGQQYSVKFVSVKFTVLGGED